LMVVVVVGGGRGGDMMCLVRLTMMRWEGCMARLRVETIHLDGLK
jgi:hypothetical protein